MQTLAVGFETSDDKLFSLMHVPVQLYWLAY